MIEFLSKPELEALTSFKRPSKQCEWFAKHGWPLEIGADGYPRVDKRYYNKRMMGESLEIPTEPDYDFLNAS